MTKFSDKKYERGSNYQDKLQLGYEIQEFALSYLCVTIAAENSTNDSELNEAGAPSSEEYFN